MLNKYLPDAWIKFLIPPPDYFFFFFLKLSFFLVKFIYLFTVKSVFGCVGSALLCGLLIAVASLVAEHGL